MNKTPRLSKSGIEYLDYSWGIFSGCRNLQEGICPVKACWAKGIASHYPKLYPDGFELHYYPNAIDSPKHLRKPSRIGVGWVGEIIGYGVGFKKQIFETIRQCPQHKFLFLTKNPESLIKWGKFPDNCWVGVTITEPFPSNTPLAYMEKIEATIKYISFEPLLKWNAPLPRLVEALERAGIQWVIIGAQTKPTIMPKIEWVLEITEAAEKANIPVFWKDNLKPLMKEHFAGIFRRNMPNEKD